MEPNPVIDLLSVVIPVLYGLVVLTYGTGFFLSSALAYRLQRPLLAVTLALHAASLVLRSIAFEHPPITSVFEIMTLLAASIAAAYLYIEWRTSSRTTGFFILLLPFAFQVVSSLGIRDQAVIPSYLHSMVLGFHVSAALLGYTGISLSAVYGFLYLMLYHEIKSTRFGLIYNRLPNLEMLERMSHKAEVFGFACLTVAITIGLFWLPRVFKDYSFFDPKLVGTLAIWVLYAIGLGAKKRFGWQGRRMMVLAIVAFGFVFLSMTVINLYLSGFHSFH